jgi:hypothetical protein
VRRRDADGHVRFRDDPWPENGWNIFQLDSTHGGLFCVDPVVRRERIRREVVILKTLWDLSTRIRAERLLHIVEHLFADVTQKTPAGETASSP